MGPLGSACTARDVHALRVPESERESERGRESERASERGGEGERKKAGYQIST
jgi:hypothetical protein